MMGKESEENSAEESDKTPLTVRIFLKLKTPLKVNNYLLSSFLKTWLHLGGNLSNDRASNCGFYSNKIMGIYCIS